MSLKENKDVECNVIDITDDDDVIFVNDSRTSPPEVITIVDNEKEDLNINVISVCRQLIVLEEFLYEEILAVRSLFNQALSLERTNLNSSTLLLTHTNLKFLGSLMEKLKDDVVSGIIPIIRISLVKKLTNDIIYLVENTEEIVEQVNKEVVKEIEQKKTPTVEVQSTSAIKPPTIEEQSTSVVKHPIIKEQSTSADKPPKIEKQSTSVVKLPTNEEQSTSVAKAPIDISKYDNKRMKIAVDIGKALLANGKKIITPEELDALVNVYLVVTAEMSDSESDDD